MQLTNIVWSALFVVVGLLVTAIPLLIMWIILELDKRRKGGTTYAIGR